MNFTKLLVALSVLFLAWGSSASAAERNDSDPKGIIFSAEQIKDQKFVVASGPYWTPTQKQVDKLENELPAYLKDQLKKPLKKDHSKYKRQYFGYSLNGKKVIYLNAFCDYFDYWKTSIVFVFDGGQCFFQATYDLERDKFISFSVNGEA